ncbi:unnamed protein product [Ceratitis capitata]|uniref:(Mediterranean fruit fly) hypothetical protein n=1 Tax=Ceratitis capitata TaxID=7213 RepID=A0A811UVM9_CERCA|nr:unnamed protein product [Ceratitis capitata]
MNVAGNNVGYGDDGGSSGGGVNACSITAIFNTNNNNNNTTTIINLTNCLNGNNAHANKNNNTNSILLALQQKQLLQQHQQQLQLNFATHMQAQFANDDNSPCHTPPPMTAMRNIVNNNSKCDSLPAAAATLGLPVALSLPLSLHLPLSATATPSSSSSATASNCRTVTASDAAAMQVASSAPLVLYTWSIRVMRAMVNSIVASTMKDYFCAIDASAVVTESPATSWL